MPRRYGEIKQVKAKHELVKIERMAFISKTGAMRATHSAAMELLLGLPLLHLIVQRETHVSVYSTLTGDDVGIVERKIAEESRKD